MLMDKQTKWWTPVWTGLVLDPEGKHYQHMKTAVWLYLYLLLYADRKSGFLMRRVSTISSDTGVAKDTIMRWLIILRKEGYISSRSNGRSLTIRIQKWKNSEVGKTEVQKLEISSSRVVKYPISQLKKNLPFKAETSLNINERGSPKDISIKRLMLKIDNDNKKLKETIMTFKPQNEKELLAVDIACALNDPSNLLMYISYANKYPNQVLRMILGQVKEVPIEKIKKSRAALFNHLVQKYDEKNHSN
jgi:hypothetical protein